MINVRFDVVNTVGRPQLDNTGYARYKISQIPPCGDLINIKGDPFIIINVQWAIEDTEEGTQWAYVRIIPTHPQPYYS